MKPSILILLSFGALATGCVDRGFTPADRVVGDNAVYGRYPNRQVIVTQRQPELLVERKVVSTDPNYVWIKGHWEWPKDKWVWVPGRWAKRPRPGAVWHKGEFLQQGNRMVWSPGYWSNRW